MSAVEEGQQVEAKSSIKVTRNAKGDAQFEAKVVAGVTDTELTELRRQAVHTYQELARELGGVA
jgi:hypothetical protein